MDTKRIASSTSLKIDLFKCTFWKQLHLSAINYLGECSRSLNRRRLFNFNYQGRSPEQKFSIIR